MSQAPTREQNYKHDEINNIVLLDQYNSLLNIISDVTDENYDRFKIKSGEFGFSITLYRQQLAALISNLHSNYFFNDPYPIGSNDPNTVINLQQNQNISIQSIWNCYLNY